MHRPVEGDDFMTVNVDGEDNKSGQYDNNEEGYEPRSGRDSLDGGGGISARSNVSGRRYIKRSNSVPRDESGEGGFGGENGSPSHTMEMHQLHHGRGSSLENKSRDKGYSLRHRRAKSHHHQNGYEYFRQVQKQVNAGFEPDPDYDTGGSDDGEVLTLEDIKRARKFLATIRVRSKSRKRRKSLPDLSGAVPDTALNLDALGGGDGQEVEEEEFEEQIGLPSSRQRMKGLAERMQLAKSLDSVSAVVTEYHYKDQIWDIGFGHSHKGKRATRLQRSITSVKNLASEATYHVNFWSKHFKEIEGQFGIAVTTYFRFTRWLVKVNFIVFFFFLCLLYIPKFVVFVNPSKGLFVEEATPNASTFNRYIQQAFSCSSSYIKYLDNVTLTTGIAVVFDIVTGTGRLEDTFLFYGQYHNISVTYKSEAGTIGSFSTNFNMGLAYMLTMIFSFFLVFIMIVRKSSKFIQEVVIDLNKSSICTYSNAVFSSWDYCINSEETAFYKQKIVFNMFQAKLEELAQKRQARKPTRKERTWLYAKRAFINLLVIVILAASFASIYFATNFLLEQQEEELSDIVETLIEFLPSMIISVLNLIVPAIFLLLVEKEEYTPSISSNITVLRAVFLRISLVGVLIVSLYYRLQAERDRESFSCPEEGVVNVTSKCCGNVLWSSGSDSKNEKGSVKCWETYVGQQFYKLAIADVFNVCLINLSVAALRKLVVTKFTGTWWASLIGLYAFDLPIEVLDLVYSQTVCWVGMFFSPLLPLITLLKMMLFFFVKKFVLLRLCEPPKNSYRASRSYSFFQVVLLGAFTIICVTLGYMIGNITPSKSCGPFRVYSRSDYVMFDSVTDEVDSWSQVPRGIFNFFGSVGFFIPAFIILFLAIYYYWAVSRGYKHMEELLQDQIKSEAYDKQYLIARVDEVLKQSEIYKEEEW